MLARDFREQITKGLGSVIQFLKTYPKGMHKYDNIISYACTHNTAYDPQCEPGREQYLWEVMKLSSNFETLQDNVLNSLSHANEGYDLLQMFDIAKNCALNGNKKAIQIMRKEFKYNESWNCFIGAEEIIEVEGIVGFRFVTETIGSKIMSEPDYYEDDTIIDFAKEKLGEDTILSFLDFEVERNDKIRTYYDSVKNLMEKRSKYHHTEIESYEEVKKIINEYKKGSVFQLRFWGSKASEEDFHRACQEFLSETDKRKLIPFLYIFMNRPFPYEPTKIIQLAKSNREELVTASLMALKNIKDERIHELAINIIKEKTYEYDALKLLINNYSEDDYVLIENALLKSHNKHAFHSNGMVVLDILEKNFTSKCLNILIDIYKKGYCSSCRRDSIEIMIKNRIIPDWIINEAKYDCNLDIRELIGKYIKHSA